MFDTVQETY